jgi:hypothetical protein
VLRNSDSAVLPTEEWQRNNFAFSASSPFIFGGRHNRRATSQTRKAVTCLAFTSGLAAGLRCVEPNKSEYLLANADRVAVDNLHSAKCDRLRSGWGCERGERKR